MLQQGGCELGAYSISGETAPALSIELTEILAIRQHQFLSLELSPEGLGQSLCLLLLSQHKALGDEIRAKDFHEMIDLVLS